MILGRPAAVADGGQAVAQETHNATTAKRRIASENMITHWTGDGRQYGLLGWQTKPFGLISAESILAVTTLPWYNIRGREDEHRTRNNLPSDTSPESKRALKMNFSTPCILLSLAVMTSSLSAEETHIDVRVRSQGAKFIGTSMGGVRILIRDAATEELLASGVTGGSTGDTERIMKEKQGVHDFLATPDAAVFHATVDIDQPTKIKVEATGPLAQPQAMQTATVTQWLIPGKSIVEGDALLLTLPGFVVDILSPPAHKKLTGTPQTIDLSANVTLMCGCPVEPDGLWDATRYQIRMQLKRDGETVATHSLEYAGKPSQFKRQIKLLKPGTYEVIVYAFDPHNGNTGIDKTTFIVAP